MQPLGEESLSFKGSWRDTASNMCERQTPVQALWRGYAYTTHFFDVSKKTFVVVATMSVDHAIRNDNVRSDSKPCVIGPLEFHALNSFHRFKAGVASLSQSSRSFSTTLVQRLSAPEDAVAR